MKILQQLVLVFTFTLMLSGCKKDYKTDFTEIYFGNIGGHFMNTTYRLEDDGDVYRTNPDGTIEDVADLDKDVQKKVEGMVNDLEASSLEYYHPTHPVDGLDNFMEILIDGQTHRIYWSTVSDAPDDVEGLYEHLMSLVQ